MNLSREKNGAKFSSYRISMQEDTDYARNKLRTTFHTDSGLKSLINYAIRLCKILNNESMFFFSVLKKVWYTSKGNSLLYTV